MEKEGGAVRNGDPASGRGAFRGDGVELQGRGGEDQVWLEWIGSEEEECET